MNKDNGLNTHIKCKNFEKQAVFSEKSSIFAAEFYQHNV